MPLLQLLLPVAFPRLACAAAAADAPPPPAYRFAYVGTYTPNGGGIYLFRLDPVTAALTQLQVIDDIRNPSWLTVHAEQTRLYAVSEIDNFQGTHKGAIVSYAIDKDTCRSGRLGAVSPAATPAYVSVHPSGKFAFAANYGGGSVQFFWREAHWGEASDVRPSVGPPSCARGQSAGAPAVSDHDSPHLHMVACGQRSIRHRNDAGLDLTLV